MSDYRVRINIRNNRLLKAMEAKGFTSASKFEKSYGLHNYSMINLVNGTKAPLDRNGHVKPFVKEILEILNISLEDAFTEKQLKGRCLLPSENDCLNCEARFKTKKIQSLEQEVERFKEENQINFRTFILDNERSSRKIFKLDEENKRLKEENLKLRCCENCAHYDMVTECELTAITCTNYNKWEIKK